MPGQPQFGVPMAPQPRRSRNGLLAAVVVAILVVIAGGGGLGSYYLLKNEDSTASPSVGLPSVAPTGTSEPQPGTDPGLGGTEPEPTEDAQQGPEASAYPAEKIYDLNRVCDENIYYPEAPKRAGKAPHPVVLLVDDGDGVRSQDGTYYFDEGLSNTVKNIWAADKPGKVQMVACLDRVKEGAKIRTCKYDDPEPLNVSLMRATWKLRVVEVATGKTLLEKSLNGDDKQCPYVVFVGPDKKIHAGVSDRAAVSALRNLVKK
ncbi:hypothetical protein AB0F81_24390 [Actinoplanes sp. NPDC024001]|uniref:hypothetical protein n=1 Tax=Actinoplanes sp. NPDC024001 TaxID=3154598 RepID=UPI0033CABA78